MGDVPQDQSGDRVGRNAPLKVVSVDVGDLAVRLKSWTTPRRVVAKVEHHRGELFPRVGFIVGSTAARRPRMLVTGAVAGNDPRAARLG